MWEAQADWTNMDKFYVSCDNEQYQIVHKETEFKSVTPGATVSSEPLSFSVSNSKSQCTFVIPARNMDIHKKIPINCCAISQNGDEIVTGDSHGKLYFTYKNTEPVPLEGQSEDFDIFDVAVSREHMKIYAASGDFSIYIFSLDDYMLQGTLKGHKGGVTRLIVYDKYLISGSTDGTVKIWDSNRMQCVATGNVRAPVNDLAIFGSIIFAATDSAILALDATTGKALPSPTRPEGFESSFTAVAAAEGRIYAGTDNGELLAWDAASLGAPAAHWELYPAAVNRLRADSGKLWAATNDGTAAAVDIEKKEVNTLLGTPAYEPVRSIAFGDGRIVTVGDSGIISIFVL